MVYRPPYALYHTRLACTINILPSINETSKTAGIIQSLSPSFEKTKLIEDTLKVKVASFMKKFC